MPYDVELSDAAFETLDGFNPDLLASVREHLLKLADAPARLSRPSSSPPDPPGYQKFEFWVSRHDFVKVFFKYRVDEQTIWIGLIGHEFRGVM